MAFNTDQANRNVFIEHALKLAELTKEAFSGSAEERVAEIIGLASAIEEYVLKGKKPT